MTGHELDGSVPQLLETRDGRWWQLTQAICTLGREMSVEGRLRQTAVAAAETTRARYAALVLFDRSGSGVEQVVYSATDPGDIAATREFLALRLGRSPRPVSDVNVDESEAAGRKRPSLGRHLVVPIKTEVGAVGALYAVEPCDGDEFGPDDRRLLVSLAETAGVGVDCATAFEESERRGDWLDASSTISQHLLGFTLEVTEIVQQIVDHVHRLTRARSVTLVMPCLNHPELLEVRTAAGLGAQDLPQVSYPRAGSLADAAWTAGAGVAEPSSRLVCGHDQVATDHPVGPVLAVPFGSQDRAGALVVSRSKADAPFSAKDISMTEDFARQAALALELARSRVEHQELQLQKQREQLAQQLQDSVIQQLFSAGLRLEAARGMTTEPLLLDRLHEIGLDLDATIREVRTVLTSH